MKYTTLYPHQRHQNLARLLLTIWLFTICSPEATFAVSPSTNPAPIDKDWVVVPHSSSGPQGEPLQVPSIAQKQALFEKAQQALAALSEILSAGGKQALLEKVQQAQQDLNQAFSDKNPTTRSPTNTPRQQHSEQSLTKTYEQKLPSLQGFQEAISSMANLAKRSKQTACIVNHLLPIVVVGLLWTYALYKIDPSAFLELTRSDAKWTSIAIEKMKKNNMLSPGIDDKLQQAIDRLWSALWWRFCWRFCWRAGVVMLTFWGSSFSLTFRQKLVASYERPV